LGFSQQSELEQWGADVASGSIAALPQTLQLHSTVAAAFVEGCSTEKARISTSISMS
jgi:hypothetical protein